MPTRIFLSDEHQQTFEPQGFIVLPLQKRDRRTDDPEWGRI